jgi:RNA polymerase sigma factor (sigma-70 family)
MAKPTSLPVEELLRDERWLRALAGRVVAGADVDDVVQDAMVAALRAPPRDPLRLRAWLGRVVHHFALRHQHGERRRAARERGAARPEALPAVDATLERLALARRVTEAVVALPEPYRSTLLWHFHDEVPVRVLAQRGDTTEANVRKRLERGLAMVRGRMASELGSDWRAALAPLAPGSVIAMKKSVVVAVAVCLVVGGALVGLWPELLAGRELPAAVVAAGSVSHRDAVDPMARARAPQPLERAPITTCGRTVDVEGRPVPHVEFAVAGQPVRSDGEGRFALAGDLSLTRLQFAGAGYHVLQAGARETEAGAREVVLVLAAAVELVCDIRDDTGDPLDGVAMEWSVRAPARENLAPLPDLVIVSDGTSEVQRPARDGECSAWNTAGTGGYTTTIPAAAIELRFTKAGHVPRAVCLGMDGTVQPPAAASPRPDSFFLDLSESQILQVAKWPKVWRDDICLHVTLDRVALPACRITGRVLTARDAPVAGALVGFQKHLSTTTDADGRFALDLDPQELPGKAPPLFAAKPGMCTALLADVVERLRRSAVGAIEVELRLGDAPLAITGRVRDGSGAPCAGLLVFPWDTEDLGELGAPEDLALPADAPEIRAGLGGRRAIARTDAEGRFTLPGLLDRDYRLRICDHTWLVSTTGVVRAGAEVEVVLGNDKCDLEIAGTARDRHGVPLADVQVSIACIKDRGFGGGSWIMVELGRTDAQGRYRVRRVMREGVLHFRKEGCIEQRADMLHWSGGALDVVLAGACEFQLEGNLTWQNIELRDAQDRAVPIEGDNPNIGGARDALEVGDAGRTKPAVTSEVVASIVLLRQGGRLERRAIQLVPGRKNVIRL